MVIVRRSTKPGCGLLKWSGALTLALAILAPCRAASLPDATAPKLTTLYSFPGTPGGSFPEAGVVRNSTTGVLYGTTADGGAHGWGTVYQLVPGTGGTWTQSVLYSFNPGASGTADGASPQAGVIIGAGGVLYGTTAYGGTTDDGTAFSLTPPTGSGAWTEKVIHNFTGGADGAQPEASLLLSLNTGTLYGTTYAGGTAGFGTVFQLTPAAGGAWNERVLYSFTGATDGGNPVADLTQATTTQILYGTTYTGGALGYGTVFQLKPATGGVWTQSVIYSFTNGTDGSGPQSGVILHNVKVGTTQTFILYGTTFWAGSGVGCSLGGFLTGCGTAFSLAPPTTAGAPWTFTLLHTFTGVGHEGAHPSQDLSLNGTSGALYGTTFSGGSTTNVCFGASYLGCGAVFVLRPPTTSGGAWVESILHDFNGDDGGGPNGVVPGLNGIYYGTTYNGGLSGGYGSVFQLTPQ